LPIPFLVVFDCSIQSLVAGIGKIQNERNNPKKRKKKEFDAMHELGASSSEKQLNGLLLKKVEFLDVPLYE
jgi:hypothetical protein